LQRFTQYLASSNCTFQLSNFLDKNGVKGYEMSTFIRRYAKYLNEKALSYRTVAFDFTKIKRGYVLLKHLLLVITNQLFEPQIIDY
jgi:hypothetical protein